MTTENPAANDGTVLADANANAEASAQPESHEDMAAKLFGDDPTDGKPAGDKPAEETPPAEGDKPADGEGEKKPDGDKPEGAPENYEEFTMPEGVAFEGESLDEFKGLAKELNLTQEQAQKLADIGAKQAAKMADQPAKLVAEARVAWEQETRNDKEIGGANLDKNLAVAKKALDAFGTPELKKLLNESALGNHPDVVRFFVRAGKQLGEDTMVRGGSGNDASTKSAAEILYG